MMALTFTLLIILTILPTFICRRVLKAAQDISMMLPELELLQDFENTTERHLEAVTAESHRVTSLPGLAVDSKIVHYAGLLTVDAEKEGNMFYWLIEAEGVDPVTGTHSVPFR